MTESAGRRSLLSRERCGERLELPILWASPSPWAPGGRRPVGCTLRNAGRQGGILQGENLCPEKDSGEPAQPQGRGPHLREAPRHGHRPPGPSLPELRHSALRRTQRGSLSGALCNAEQIGVYNKTGRRMLKSPLRPGGRGVTALGRSQRSVGWRP